ncbi:MAG: sigma 54-interacting transcriptional regulator [Desulfuromonadales bacterium]
MDQELLEIIFDNVANGIYIVDGKGVTIRVNKPFEEMSGFTNAELVGRSLYDLVGPDNYFSGSASLLVIEKKVPVTATYSTRTGRKLLVKGRPVFDDSGAIRYIINTIWDLTVVQYSKKIDADTARTQMLNEEDIVTCSQNMSDVIDLALRVAGTDSTILLTGESGVGKSLLAKVIHRASERKHQPLLQINCAAIPETLLEAELFGYESGAFTGADRKGKAGLFEQANGGTIFLDEITEIPLHLQSKLLGVIQDKAFHKIGGRGEQSVDVRIIAATNRDLAAQVALGRFREDLYYRLNVVPVQIPPLRQRREDIALLIRYFTDHYNRRYNSYKRFSETLIKRMTAMPWKGNIRELENVVERMIVTSTASEIESLGPLENDAVVETGASKSLVDLIQDYEDTLLIRALKEYRTTRKIAIHFGMSQPTVARKLKNLRQRRQIERP